MKKLSNLTLAAVMLLLLTNTGLLAAQTPPDQPGLYPTVKVTVTSLSNVPIKRQSGQSPVVWGTLVSGTLTLNLGYLSEGVTPKLSGAHAIARWTSVFRMCDMAISPDGNTLLLGIYPPAFEFAPHLLYVVDLNTNRITEISASLTYTNAGNYPVTSGTGQSRVVGWLNNEQFVVEGNGLVDEKLLLVGKNNTISDLSERLGLPRYRNTSLSPDRRTMFVGLNDAYDDRSGTWLVGADGSNLRRLGQDRTSPSQPSWSPDSKTVAFGDFQVIKQSEEKVLNVYWPTLLNVADGSLRQIKDTPVADGSVVWSPNSSRVAFIRADDQTKYSFEQYQTSNVYFAKVSDLKPVAITKFKGVANRDLQYTPSGSYLLLASGAGSKSGQAMGLTAINASTGKVTTLVAAPAGGSVVKPLVFR